MPSSASASKVKQQLTREDWVNAAIDVMVQNSEAQVMVERLGAALGVSRGSFYWHFRSRDELMGAILERWTQTATISVQEHLDHQEPDAARRLLLYMRLPVKSTRSLRAADLELAILGWARRSEVARKAVARVDALRTRHFTELFAELGFSGAEGRRRTHIALAFMRYISMRRDIAVEERLELINTVHASLVGRGS